MARGGGKRRTYVRDNRGRFASTGATARGGRLKTAAGNKRKTVTARMAPAKAAGTIGKRKGVSYEKAKPVAMKAKAGVAGKPLGGDRKILAASATARAGRMKPPITLKRMQQIGGNRWQKKGMDRVYFNDLPQRAGMDVSKYKSGNISSASLRGRGISNSKAKEIYGNLADSKVYYDRTKRRMVSQGPYIPSGRSSQRTKAAVLLGSVAKKLERQSRIRPTLRANQKRRKAA